jgi:prophage regulatory protein
MVLNAVEQECQTGMGETILRLSQARAKTGLGRSTIYAEQKAGRFPKSISLGKRAVGFLASEIDQWIADRIAASRGELAK